MGQRLVITLKKKNKIFASIYYHWDAYTKTAIEDIDNLLDFCTDIDTIRKDNLSLSLIRYIEWAGGGVDGTDLENVQKMFPTETFECDGSRNKGLVALSETAINNQVEWAEGLAEINFDNDTITFDVFGAYCPSLEALNEEYECSKEDGSYIAEEDVYPVDLDDCTYFYFDELSILKKPYFGLKVFL